ncbi:hypothetical protein HG531_004823 [Fusarium graminearum]|nr:hypothetical protein HG531_004823 [Fusarium graminearum]
MEDKFVATIGIFLPASQLVVKCERDTLLEPAVVICCKTHDTACHLDTKTDVKIFRHMSIGPPLLLAIAWIDKGDVLHCFPAEESIVTNEGGHVTRADTVFDGSDCNFGALVHLQSTVVERVNRDSRVTVDDQDELSNADVALSPCASSTVVFSQHVGQSLLVEEVVVINIEIILAALALLALNLSQANQLILNAIGERKAVVHVTSLLKLALAQESDLVGEFLRRHLRLILLGIVPGILVQLLEPGQKAAFLGSFTVGKTSGVTDTVFAVISLASLSEIVLDDLHAIVVDENRGSTALLLVILNGSHNTDHRGNDDTLETFLVHRHLDGDVGQLIVAMTLGIGLDGGVESGILETCADGEEQLEDTGD